MAGRLEPLLHVMQAIEELCSKVHVFKSWSTVREDREFANAY